MKLTRKFQPAWALARPCPFCGYTPNIRLTASGKVEIACDGSICRIGPKIVASRRVALKRWNHRLPDRPPEAPR